MKLSELLNKFFNFPISLIDEKTIVYFVNFSLPVRNLVLGVILAVLSV